MTICFTCHDWHLVVDINLTVKWDSFDARSQIACYPGLLGNVHLGNYQISLSKHRCTNSIICGLKKKKNLWQQVLPQNYYIHGPITWFLETTRSGTKMGHRPTSEGSPHDMSINVYPWLQVPGQLINFWFESWADKQKMSLYIPVQKFLKKVRARPLTSSPQLCSLF